MINFYQTNFALMNHHKWSITEIENMIPWEREIYITLLMDWIKSEEARAKTEGTTHGGRK
jgi:hypothetical protein